MPIKAPRWPTDELIEKFNHLAEDAHYPGKHYDSLSPSRWHFMDKLLDFGREHLDQLRRRP